MTKCIRREGSVWTICRCVECKRRNARIAKRVRSGHSIVTGREAAWDRLRIWHQRQWSIQVVADLTGLADDTARMAYRAIDGNRPPYLLNQQTVRRILDAGDTPIGNGFIPAIGSTRKLRALTVMGWSMDELASRYEDADASTFSMIRTGRLPTVRARSAAAVSKAYNDLEMTPGPSRLASTRAKNLGWLPPFAWDDIDDPTETPNAVSGGPCVDEVAVLRLLDGHPVQASMDERREAVRRLVARGASQAEAAERVGVTDRTVSRWRTAGLLDEVAA